ncbi:MAG: tRNA (adenosine(37)-N6)-dimethylallyltransferase MiaA [Candidatus Absconditabacteria bacterium]
METKDFLPQVIEKINKFQLNNPNGVVVIRGATATGKTGLSMLLSEFFPIEVISSDSRQIFKYMDIGTDKISLTDRQKVLHYQIDFLDPSETYTAAQWKKETLRLVPEILGRNKIPFIVGGTGLYIDTIYKNFDMPQVPPDMDYREMLERKELLEPGVLHNMLTQIDPNEGKKVHPKSLRHIIRALEIYHKTGKTKTDLALQKDVNWPMLMIGLRREKEDTNYKIDKRIGEMIEIGLIEEVKMLLDKLYSPQLQSMSGIGYKEIVEYLQGKCELDQAVERLKINTHRYAKRQRTWFRRYIYEMNNQPKNNVTYSLFNLTDGTIY